MSRREEREGEADWRKDNYEDALRHWLAVWESFCGAKDGKTKPDAGNDMEFSKLPEFQPATVKELRLKPVTSLNFMQWLGDAPDSLRKTFQFCLAFLVINLALFINQAA